MKKGFDFATAMKELEEINRWFQDEDIDLDQGLEKLKRAKELILQCRDRLKNVENEFVKIKDEFAEPEERVASPKMETPIFDAPKFEAPKPATESRYMASKSVNTPSSGLPDPFANDPDDDDLPF